MHLNLNSHSHLLLKQLKTVFWWHNPLCVQGQTWKTKKAALVGMGVRPGRLLLSTYSSADPTSLVNAFQLVLPQPPRALWLFSIQQPDSSFWKANLILPTSSLKSFNTAVSWRKNQILNLVLRDLYPASSLLASSCDRVSPIFSNLL